MPDHYRKWWQLLITTHTVKQWTPTYKHIKLIHNTHRLSFRNTCLHNLLSGSCRLINQIQVVSNFDNIVGSFYKPVVELNSYYKSGSSFLNDQGSPPLTYLLFPQLKSHKTRKFEVEYYFTINVVSQGLSLSRACTVN